MYYPIIDSSTNQVVYLIETIGIDGRYICNPLDHMVDVLNEIDYINNDSVAYYLNVSIRKPCFHTYKYKYKTV